MGEKLKGNRGIGSVVRFLGYAAGALSVFRLSQMVLQFDVSNAMQAMLRFYIGFFHPIADVAKPLALAVCAWLGLELPTGWRELLIAYLVFAGAFFRMARYIPVRADSLLLIQLWRDVLQPGYLLDPEGDQLAPSRLSLLACTVLSIAWPLIPIWLAVKRSLILWNIALRYPVPKSPWMIDGRVQTPLSEQQRRAREENWQLSKLNRPGFSRKFWTDMSAWLGEVAIVALGCLAFLGLNAATL